MSKGIFKRPNKPKTHDATNIFGNIPINTTFNDLNKTNNIRLITKKTNPKELICDEKSD
jgi:hypothetical protein